MYLQSKLQSTCAQVRLRKTLLVVKFSAILLMLISMKPAAAAQQKNPMVEIHVNESSLKEVLYTIREQSGIDILFKEEQIAHVNHINLDMKAKVSEVLNYCLDGKNLQYEVVDNIIVIKPLDTEPDAPKEQQKQEKIIKGKVVDEKNQPIPGANIVVKDGYIGTSSNANGEFSMKLNSAVEFIEVSFLGYKSKTISIKGKLLVNIQLKPDVQELEDVVVTGIINRKVSTFTGAVTTIKGDELKEVSNDNVFESIKNLDPSIMLIDNMDLGSDPNAVPEIQLRGSSSFDLGGGEGLDIKGTYGVSANAPLFILDGFEASVVKVLDLDMDRVESITILKDASAKTIYGSKAANGVIVIETKVGKGNKAIVHYNGSVSIEVPDFSSYNLMSAEEKLDFEIGFGLYGEKNGVWGEEVYQQRLRAVKEGVNTNWMAKPVQNGVGTKQRISFELGDETLRLFAGFTYNNIQGAMKKSSRENYTGDISVSYRYKKLNVRNQLSINSNISNSSPYGSFSEYVRMNPYFSPYDKDGNLQKTVTGDVSEAYNVGNPLWNAQLSTVLRNEYLDVTNNLYANMYWNDHLRSSLRMGISIQRVEGNTFYPADHTKFNTYTTDDLIWRRGSYQSNEGRSKTLSGDFNTTYSRYFGDHYLMFNLGGQLSEQTYDEVIYKAEGLPSEDMNSIMFAKQYAENTKPTGVEETRREISGLGILNYAYDNRYLFDASVRSSGSSQYGANKRWGTFWSAGLGWNIHEEEWLTNDHIQRLKLRASLGTTGSQIPDAYAGAATYRYILDKTYTNMYGLTLIGMRNDDLQWQQKLDKNIGLELNAFNKLSIVLDIYESTTKNTLIKSTLPPSTGFPNVDENMGEVLNRGIDMKATYTLWSDPKERSYLNLIFNASHNKNEIRKLSDAMKEYNNRINALFDKEKSDESRPLNKYVEGVSMTSIWAVPSAGIDPANGRELFIKQDGSKTYDYSASDQRVMGNTLPDVHGNIGTSLQYKGFGLNLTFYYLLGAQMYNYTLSEKVEAYNIKYNVDRRVLDGAWLEPGDVKPYARHRDYMGAGIINGTYTMRASKPTGRFVFDRNELSLSSVNVSYDFWKHNWIKKIGLSRLKVSAYGNNLYTWSSVDVERGVSYPFARTYNFSVSATF